MRTHPEVLKPAAQTVASGLETLLKAAVGFEPGAIECADTLSTVREAHSHTSSPATGFKRRECAA